MSESTQTSSLKVDGMHCGGCAGSVQRALIAVEGVESARVELEAGIATIRHEAGVSSEQLVAAVEAKGFSAAALS